MSEADKAWAAFQEEQVELARRVSLGLCANCGEREGTIRWGDALSLTHGGGQMWCAVCAYSTQLEHARERAAAIPELEAKLSEAIAGSESASPRRDVGARSDAKESPDSADSVSPAAASSLVTPPTDEGKT